MNKALPDTSEVVVIGGGVIGCSIAHRLAKDGFEVMLVEREGICSGASGANQGEIPINTSPPPMFDLVLENSKLLEALDDEIDHDFELERTGVILATTEDCEVPMLEEYADRLCRSGGSPRVVYHKEVTELCPSLSSNVVGALIGEEDCLLNPMSLTYGLARAAKRQGVKIFTFTEVKRVKVNHGEVDSVVTEKGVTRADYVINAAGIWASTIGAMVGVDIPVYPMRGQVIITEPLPLANHRFIVEFEPSYHLSEWKLKDELNRNYSGVGASLAQTKSGNWTIGSSLENAGLSRDTTPGILKLLAKRAIKYMPSLEHVLAIRTFAGLRPCSDYNLPIIKESENVRGFLIAACHGMFGIALSQMTAVATSELIRKGKISTQFIQDSMNMIKI